MEIFDSLYDEFFKSVYAYFSICLGREVAEDLTQQTFMNIYNYLSNNSFFIPDSWKAWIFRIAVNVKNDYLRKNVGKETLVLEEYTAASDDIQDASIDSLAIKRAFASLSKKDREMILLKYLGVSGDEASEITGVTSSAVRSRLSVAKQHFKAALQVEGLYLEEGKK